MPRRGVVDIVRHAMPLVPLYFFHGDVPRYLLMTAFDLALGLMLIVGMTREKGDITSVDPRSRAFIPQTLAVLVIAVFLAVVAAVVALPISAPAIIFGLASGTDWASMLTERDFWLPVAGMSLLAAIRYQVEFNRTTVPGQKGLPSREGIPVGDLAADRKAGLAANAAQVTLIGTFLALSYAVMTIGWRGMLALPALYAAALVFYDARPDIGQSIFPKLWQAK